MDELGQLSALSAEIGNDLSLVQAGGGNTSLKAGDVMWVKASGTWLVRAGEEEIFVAAPLRDVLEAVDAGREYVTECETPSGARLKPSVETTMHAVLSQRVIVHVHSVEVIALAAQANATDVLQKQLDGLRWAWLPYVHPGVELAQVIRDLPRPEPDVIVMGNHGLVIAAADCDGGGALLRDVERRLQRIVRPAAAPDIPKLQAVIQSGYRLPQSEEVHAIGTDEFSTAMAIRGILFPDQCVYLGAPGIVTDRGAAEVVDEFTRSFGAAPKYLIVPGAGVLVSEQLDRAGWELLVGVKRVLERLDAAVEVQVLDTQEVSRLLNWDAEKYRAALARRYSLQ
jgi:rhamnose utilization protein RhaD (predicted bifunctional aldolase and dehydrogenase)